VIIRIMVPIVIVSGPSGSGKTTLCQVVLAHAQARGLDCAGVLCPARFHDGRKVGIDLLDIRRASLYPLAEADDEPGAIRTVTYRFHPAALAAGSAALRAATPCDLLLVDELGPLELVRGEGWVDALQVLRSGRFRLAVVVVRPTLVGSFRSTVPDADVRTITVPAARPEEIAAEILTPLFA
jgi:nucleoside-triphosphatase THEP1